MSILQALFLGVLQGIAEFLPISSSGHLLLAKHAFGLAEVPVLFDVLLHLATLFAILLVFRDRIIALFISFFAFIRGKAEAKDRENLRVIAALLVTTGITAVLGYFVNKIDLESSPKIVSGLLIVTGIILISTLFFRGRRSFDTISWKDGLITGIGQGIGVFPGISRSGITIAFASAAGLERDKAGEYAFLVSIPAVLGAFILKLKDADNLMAQVDVLPLIIALVASFIVGIISLKLLMKLIKKGALAWFALYLIPVGILGMIFLN